MKLLLTIAASWALAACAVGPNFKAPVNAPATLVNAQSSALAPLAPRSPDGQWWQQFDDSTLNDLMARALESNLDLKLAGDRVRAAHAVFAGAEYDYGPHVPLQAGYAGSKEQVPGFGTQRYNEESYNAGLDVAWELDLFGHVRRTVEAARGDLAAEQEDLEYARIAVAAEVARNYFSLRSTQQQIKVAHDNLANQEQAVHLTSVRYESGRGTELDVQSSRARLKATEALLPQLETRASRRTLPARRAAGPTPRHPGCGTATAHRAGVRQGLAHWQRRAGCGQLVAQPTGCARSRTAAGRGHRTRRRCHRGFVSARHRHRLRRLSVG